jgi:hypothetical protein
MKFELGIDNLELDSDRLEEFYATIIQNDYSEILKITDTIVNELLKEPYL